MSTRILFATDRMHLPDDHSGSVQTTHALTQGLVQRGYECEVLATLASGLRYTIATIAFRLTAGRFIAEWNDRTMGYVVHRGSEWRFDERLRRRLRSFQPEIIVLDSIRQLRRLAESKVDIRCPIVLFVHDVKFLDEPKALPYADCVVCVANSPYTAQELESHFSISPIVIPPLVDFPQYTTVRTAAKYVTMISPTRQKGVETSLHLAASFPDTPFLFVEGWPMSAERWAELAARVASLPNVALRRSTSDMRTVYADTRILLVPTQQRGETFGRVVVEAQCNGIPVLASDRGALRWVVGTGGAVLAKDASNTEWESALRTLLQDPERYSTMSDNALSNAARPEFQPSQLLAEFERVIRSCR